MSVLVGPAIISPASGPPDFAEGINSFGWFGPYEHGDVLYCLFRAQGTTYPNPTLQVFKSTDSGATWNPINWQNVTDGFSIGDVYFDSDAGKIYIVGRIESGDRPTYLITFTMDGSPPDTFDDGEDITTNIGLWNAIILRPTPDGSLLLLVNGNPSGSIPINQMFMLRKSPGSPEWAGPATMHGTAGHIQWLAVDEDGASYAIYGVPNSGEGFLKDDWYMRSFSSATASPPNTPGDELLITTNVSVQNFNYTFPPGQLAQIFDGQMFVMVGPAGIFRGPLAGTSPAFVQTSLAVPNVGQFPALDFGNSRMVLTTNLLKYGTGLYLIFAVGFQFDESGENVTVDSVYTQKYLGSDIWESPALGVNFLANPPDLPQPPGASSTIHTSSFLSSGAVGMIVFLFESFPEENGAFYYVAFTLGTPAGFGNVWRGMTQHLGNCFGD